MTLVLVACAVLVGCGVVIGFVIAAMREDEAVMRARWRAERESEKGS